MPVGRFSKYGKGREGFDPSMGLRFRDGAQEGDGRKGKCLPFRRVSALPGFESQGTSRFMEGGKAMRWRKLLLDQLGIEGDTIEIAQAAEQPQQFLIPQVSL